MRVFFVFGRALSGRAFAASPHFVVGFPLFPSRGFLGSMMGKFLCQVLLPIYLEICVKGCNGNPFWVFSAQKDCNGKPGPKGNAQIIFKNSYGKNCVNLPLTEF